MKIKSLLLGSIAATGLSAGAFAADLNVLTSLDVCDALGISGLTISSDTNCLQITGEVKYEFSYGNYNGNNIAGANFIGGGASVMMADGAAGVEMDWLSKVDAYLKFVGTADSDFGPASATIKFDYDNDYIVKNEVMDAASSSAAGYAVRIEEAYVSVGDSTVIMAGQKGSVFNSGDDSSYAWLKPYNYDAVDTGVETAFTDVADAGPSHVIQVVSDLGNGFSVSAGIENLNGVNTNAAAYANANPVADDGTMVGVLAYKGDTVTAHASLIGGGFLDGTIERWGVHAGVAATVDMFKFTAAIAADNAGEWNALASAQATFDMFTLAATVEGDSGPKNTPAAGDQWGVSVSGAAAVTEAVTLNLGFRWADADVTAANTEIWTAAAGLAFAATETITLTGEVGIHGTNMAGATANVIYGSAEAAWAPGGGYTSSIKGEVNSINAYKVTYKAAKSFK